MRTTMLPRAREDDGFGLIELLIAMVVLSIALLALMAGYDSAFISMHNASHKSTAATLANQQLELYSALPYASIGLDQTAIASANSDATYAADKATLNAAQTGTDITIASCGTSAQCTPIQNNVTGSDHHHYRLETFIRDVTVTGSSPTWTERFVTVVVRDHTSGAQILHVTAGFDQGP